MANEVKYSDLSSWLNTILEATEFYLQKRTMMPQLVQVFNDTRSSVARKSDKYSAGTVATLTEGTDMTSKQAFTRTAFATITPAEVGTYFVVTDQRLDSDNVANIQADLALHIANTMATHIDEKLLAAMGSVSAGTVGTAGSALTWDIIMAAYSRLRAAGVPGPYNCVLHEYQWYDLGIGRQAAIPLTVEPNLAQSNYYVGSFGDVRFYATGNLTAGTSVLGAMFNPMALAYDIRRPVRIEVERDATLRASEFVATHIYGYNVWRGDMGVLIQTDASAPS